ncbi:MAG: di-trans,poly-cis-decaprenylcistransferase [Myxococcales bacterium]|nr:di-trans,poly-cis-decaprenylcistransferase [Myxococcales bacterium]
MSTLDPDRLPHHVAIIPDGNGRWAEKRGLSRMEGHRRGTETVQEVVRAAHELGIRELTLYAWSQENWGRPTVEVNAIMRLLHRYLRKHADELVENGIRLETLGRIQELPGSVRRELERVQRRTEGFNEMRLNMALSYSGRTEIVDAVRRIARAIESGQLEPEAIDEKTIGANLYAPESTEPDLLIRTGAEHRVSNYLLWQLAYTELYFSEALWPDFSKADLVAALREFQGRERRFGRTAKQLRAEP